MHTLVAIIRSLCVPWMSDLVRCLDLRHPAAKGYERRNVLLLRMRAM